MTRAGRKTRQKESMKSGYTTQVGNPLLCNNKDLLVCIVGEQNAAKLLSRFSSFYEILQADYGTIAQTVGKSASTRIWAALEMSRRIEPCIFEQRRVIRSAKDVASYYIPKMRGAVRESFYTLLLNSANQVFKESLVSVGSLNASIVHPREVFAEAITNRAASVILLHNHPSGNPEPSREDLAITRQLREAGAIIDIKVLDHVIIAGDSYTSLAERALL